MTEGASFEEYLGLLAPFTHEVPEPDPKVLELCERATKRIADLDHIDRKGLAIAIAEDPQIVSVFAAAVGLSQERFKSWLQAQFGTAGWVSLGRQRPNELVDALDDDFAVVALLTAHVARDWTWSDVLARVMAPRQRAGASIRQGRNLEDAVEEQLSALGLEYVPRTRFVGKDGNDAPSDFAIPNGAEALIAVAVKGFDSTGSKLSDAAREIEQMVAVRTPRQFIYAVVDGQGWLRRQGDLRRIHSLREKQLIDGLYTRAQLPEFGAAVRGAALRLGLL